MIRPCPRVQLIPKSMNPQLARPNGAGFFIVSNDPSEVVLNCQPEDQ